jgi:Na+-translocating ferredoxin:NAD+ oxidoreductase subunit B
MAESGGALMILSITLILLLVLLLSLILFFMFAILLPAMKMQSFFVDNPIFSEIELKYVIPSVDPHVDMTKHAVVLCSPEKKFREQRLNYNQGQSCKTINQIYESVNDCRFSCIGLGDCAKICPQEAIVIKNNTAVVTELCCGCGKCIEVCPKHIIKLLPLDVKKYVLCNNCEDSLTTCSDYKKEQNIEIPAKKGFKIWKTCYKMINRR